MHLAYLLLFTGLTISAVAIYYSVIGLTSIFSAAVVPIIVMGTTLEIAKLVAASWLKAYWKKAPKFIKSYMMIAIVVLMMITSMGIFGFLSKAHSDQSLVSGEVLDKIATIEEKIKTQRENIDSARKALKQLDESVDQTVARSTSEKSVIRAVDIRKSQNKERSLLRSEIESAQKIISQLNEEKAPISKDLRKVEAEVGPIKYIAAFVYGENPDQNLLEKAVTWVIIIIVIVFDPLAVIMLIAAQMSFSWLKEEPLDCTFPASNSKSYNTIVPVNTVVDETSNQIFNNEEEIISNLEIKDNIDFHLNTKDKLYNEYSKDNFSTLIVDKEQEPELAEFIEQTKIRPRFNNYSSDMLTYFARRIYELRKNNSNNTP